MTIKVSANNIQEKLKLRRTKTKARFSVADRNLLKTAYWAGSAKILLNIKPENRGWRLFFTLAVT